MHNEHQANPPAECLTSVHSAPVNTVNKAPEYRSESNIPGPREGDIEEKPDCLAAVNGNPDSMNYAKRKRTMSADLNQISAQTDTTSRLKPGKGILKNLNPANKIGARVRQSYRHVQTPQGTKERVIHYVCHTVARTKNPRHYKPRSGIYNAATASLSSQQNISRTQTEEIEMLDTQKLPNLASSEDIFDLNEYLVYHRKYDFNLDAAASAVSNKCKDYCSTANPFEALGPKDLENKTVWIFPPTDKANSIISHFEGIRRKQPTLTKGVIVIPKIMNTPGIAYKSILSGYSKIHTYPKGTYLFKRYNEKTLALTKLSLFVVVFLSMHFLRFQSMQ